MPRVIHTRHFFMSFPLLYSLIFLDNAVMCELVVHIHVCIYDFNARYRCVLFHTGVDLTGIAKRGCHAN